MVFLRNSWLGWFGSSVFTCICSSSIIACNAMWCFAFIYRMDGSLPCQMAEFIYLKIQAKMIQSFLRIRLLENLWFFYIYNKNVAIWMTQTRVKTKFLCNKCSWLALDQRKCWHTLILPAFISLEVNRSGRRDPSPIHKEKGQTQEGAGYGRFHREGKRKEVQWKRYSKGDL